MHSRPSCGLCGCERGVCAFSCVCPRLRSLLLESELGEGWFLVAVVANCVNDQVFCLGHVGAFVAAGCVYFADEGFAGSGRFVKCDVPDAALSFAPTFGSDILLNIVVGVPGFGDDSARYCVVVEADGGVGACLWVAGEPVAGGIPVEPAWATPRLVDSLHDALFNVWGDGRCVGGVFVCEVTHGVALFSWSRCMFAYSHCSARVGCASTVLRIHVARLHVFVGAIGWCARLVSCLAVGSVGARLLCDRVMGSVVNCGWFSCWREG